MPALPGALIANHCSRPVWNAHSQYDRTEPPGITLRCQPMYVMQGSAIIAEGEPGKEMCT